MRRKIGILVIWIPIIYEQAAHSTYISFLIMAAITVNILRTVLRCCSAIGIEDAEPLQHMVMVVQFFEVFHFRHTRIGRETFIGKVISSEATPS